MVKTFETPRRVVVGNTTVHIVERTRVSAHRVGKVVWFQGQKDCTSIVVVGPRGIRRFTLEESGPDGRGSLTAQFSSGVSGPAS